MCVYNIVNSRVFKHIYKREVGRKKKKKTDLFRNVRTRMYV